ncbi:MAG TPA: hypothetical protein VMS40_12830 [Vicinamibacterales bacterium]|nr:hypothetical protein [Vicinamibacterales bacterium]
MADAEVNLIAFKLAIVAMLSSFMMLSAVSFFRFRLKKKERDFERIMHILGLHEDNAAVFSPTIKNEYSAVDYILPVAFATVVCLAGFGFAFFARELVSVHTDKQNLLLSGIYTGQNEGELQALRWQSAFVLVLAFLGGFIWSAQSIIRRLITADLSPGTFYGAGVRMIFASLVALVLSWFLKDMPGRDHTLPVIAFLTGMLPEQAVLFLQDKSKIFSNTGAARSRELPLMMIEGVNTFHKVRLGEVAIDNSQNLAEANLIELLLRTPFPANQVIDWIAQAKLHVFVKDDIEKLRAIGIRNAFDFVAESSESLDQLAAETRMPRTQLSIVYRRLHDDPAIPALWRFRSLLSGFKGAPERSLEKQPERHTLNAYANVV